MDTKTKKTKTKEGFAATTRSKVKARKSQKVVKAEEVNKDSNLGLLKAGTRKIYLVALPTMTKAVVLNYSSHLIKLSCAIPSEKHRIIIKYPGLGGGALMTEQIKALPTILTTEYNDFPKYGQATQPIASFYLFTHNTRVKKSIQAAPYLISNVYKDGRICFGKTLKPSNPREAYNYFWNSKFNNELWAEHIKAVKYQGKADLISYIKSYHDTVFMDQPWDDYTGLVCGSKFWAAPKGADAVLFSDNKWLLQQVPKKYWKRNVDNYPFIVALAIKKDGYWEFDGGQFKFSLSESNITQHKRYNRKCQNLKKKFKTETTSTQANGKVRGTAAVS